MKLKHLFTGLLLCLTSLICTLNSHAQTSKIAIVSAADTTFIHRHVGFTAFSNFIDTLHTNFSIPSYLEKEIQLYLAPSYSVSVVQLPDSVLKAKNGFFSSTKTKKIKQWIANQKDLYGIVIVIDNMGLSENDRLIPVNTSGIFSNRSYVSYYTTISFFAYRTSNLKLLEYYNQGGKFIQPAKGIKLPDDKKSFTPETMSILNTGFKSYLDSRIEYFLTKTYLLAQDKIDAIKAESANTK